MVLMISPNPAIMIVIASDSEAISLFLMRLPRTLQVLAMTGTSQSYAEVKAFMKFQRGKGLLLEIYSIYKRLFHIPMDNHQIDMVFV
jgi:hypothetical protein